MRVCGLAWVVRFEDRKLVRAWVRRWVVCKIRPNSSPRHP